MYANSFLVAINSLALEKLSSYKTNDMFIRCFCLIKVFVIIIITTTIILRTKFLQRKEQNKTLNIWTQLAWVTMKSQTSRERLRWGRKQNVGSVSIQRRPRTLLVRAKRMVYLAKRLAWPQHFIQAFPPQTTSPCFPALSSFLPPPLQIPLSFSVPLWKRVSVTTVRFRG